VAAVVRLGVLWVCIGCSGGGTAHIAKAADTGMTTVTLPTTGTTIGIPELCINEFVADVDFSWSDEFGVPSDWIELHNPSSEALSLSGYSLTNDADEPFAHQLDAELSIPAGGFLVFAADNQPDLGPLHLNFALSNSGETIGLFRFDGSGEVIDYGAVGEDLSWARQPDCCPDVATCSAMVFDGTPGASNGSPGTATATTATPQ
jgi:hypothetical protein